MGHLPGVLMSGAVTISLGAFGVLALAAALVLVTGAARRRSRGHTVDPSSTPTAAPRIDEEPPTMADDPHEGAPGALAETLTRTNGGAPADSPAPSGRSRSNGRSRRRATAPTTTPAEPASTPAEPASTPTEPSEVAASIPGTTRIRPDTDPEPTPDAPPVRKSRPPRASKTGMKAATPAEAASPPVPTPAVPVGPAGGRFLAPRRGRTKALLDVLDVPGAVVRRRDDVAAVLTRFYADAVRAHDTVHVVQLTDASQADVGVELHAAGHIVGDARSYADLTADATASPAAPASPGRGLHGLRRPRVDGIAVKALRGASSAVLVVDTRRSRAAAVADAAAMLDGLGVAVRGVVVWEGRVPRA